MTKKLSIKLHQTKIYVRETGRNSYELHVNRPCFIPLYTENKMPLSPKTGIVSFDYILSSPLWGIDFIFGKNMAVSFCNLQVSKKWGSASIDISEHNETLRYTLSRPGVILTGLNIIPTHISSLVILKIRNIRLRPFNKEEAARNILRKTYQERIKSPHINLNEYLHSKFPGKITNVQASETDIVIDGIVCNVDHDFYLVEIPLFSEFAPNEFHTISILQPDMNHRFTVSIPRITDYEQRYYDRIYSRWAIAVKTEDGYALASFAKYADTLNSIYAIPPITAKNKKGLGGFKINPFESDLDELDISYITINIRLNNFLTATHTNDSIPFEYHGVTYYANREVIEKYDAALIAAAKRNIIVYAIILVYPEKDSKDKKIGRLLEHPEYDTAGIYTMPNMTNPESVNLYVAAMDFLAGRYSRQDKLYGHIHRWIVHNEVDSAWIWCNAGKKTATELMELYVKSMRLIYYTTFRYNANTEVFISLTHHWRSSFDQNCYFGSTMLDLLLIYSNIEGDFRWGVAHHPYPEQLLEPKSWLDKNASDDFNTKLITFKNVELLDKWIKQPHTFYDRQEQRTMILSEQNPNSLDYSEQALMEQADSLHYVLEKVKKCSGIEAYIAHSWIDSRKEAGLKTGLRKYLNDPDDPGGKKPAWYVFKSQ